jgi:hypothetical protein
VIEHWDAGRAQGQMLLDRLKARGSSRGGGPGRPSRDHEVDQTGDEEYFCDWYEIDPPISGHAVDRPTWLLVSSAAVAVCGWRATMWVARVDELIATEAMQSTPALGIRTP